MEILKTATFKRCSYGLIEIKREIKQIKENYLYFYPGTDIEIEVNPIPDTVKYDGSMKEFEFNVVIRNNS